MMCNVRCWMPRLVVLAIATTLLSGCATVGFNPVVVSICPPIVNYSREFQARAAVELVSLPERSVVAEMLSD